MDIFAEIDRCLNQDGCAHLRLELAGSGTSLERFSRAFDRVRTLADDLYGADEHLYAVIRMFPRELPGGKRNPKLAVQRALAQVGFEGIPELARRRRRWPWKDSGLHTERLYALPPSSPALLGLLWAVCADELGVTPQCSLNLYLIDRGLTVLMHPYDDRGVDIVSPDVERLRPLWRQRHAWMLAYNLPEMTATFGPP